MREIPNSFDTERSILGCILKNFDDDNLNIVYDKIKNRDYFYTIKHKIVYDAILFLRSQSKAIDIVTVSAQLQKDKKLEKIGGRVYIVGLIEEIVSLANVKYHIEIIVDKYLLRKMISINSEIIDSCYSNDLPIPEILDKAESAIMAVSITNSGDSFDSVAHASELVMDDIEATLRGEKQFVISGYSDLDNILHGFADSNLYLIAGRPGMGKTALAMNIAENVGQTKTVGFMSLEMSKEQLAERLLFSTARVPIAKSKPTFDNGVMIPPSLTEGDNRALMDAKEKVSKLKIEIDDTPALDIQTLRSKAKQLKSKCGIELLIVDYIQLMAGVGNNRTEAVGEISRGLKIIAKELRIPVIALSQLSRALESRPDKRPMLSDLRDSGSLEQDSDGVVFTYREEMYKQHLDPQDPKRLAVEGKAELIIGKNRHGKTGIIHLAWIGDRTRFENLTYRPEDSQVNF